jgi:predicted PurR-regulated permease PerM
MPPHVDVSRSFVMRVVVAAAILALALLLWTWRHVLLLIFASLLIAVGLNSLASWISNRTPLSRGWALAVAVIFIGLIVIGAGWLFGAQVGAQLTELMSRLPEAMAKLQASVAASPMGRDVVKQIQDGAASQGAEGALGALGRVGGWTMSFAGAALDALVVVIGAIFLTVSPKRYRDGLLSLFPKAARTDMSKALDECARSLSRWLLGTLLSMVAVGVSIGVVLGLLGVPAFLALALIAGLAQFLPLIGPLIAAVPAILLAMTVGWDTAIYVALAFFAVSQMEANLLSPLIQKKAVSLEPALTLFAILAMGILLGPLGVLFAVPLTVVAVIFLRRFYIRGTLGDDSADRAKD